MTTTFDTSGGVFVTATPAEGDRMGYRWSDLSAFTQGYVEAMMATANETLSYNPKHPFRANGFSDLAPETLARIIADCEGFLSVQEPSSAAFRASAETGGIFWRNRQAGGYPTFPPLTVQLGDDGKVRFSERG